jgi:hypothetical protein
MNFILKAVVGVTVMMWIRWTLPRLRIDQVITTCLKYCVPLAAACFIGAVFWKLVDAPSLHDAAPYTWGRTFAQTRENWALSPHAVAVAAPAAPVEPVLTDPLPGAEPGPAAGEQPSGAGVSNDGGRERGRESLAEEVSLLMGGHRPPKTPDPLGSRRGAEFVGGGFSAGEVAE